MITRSYHCVLYASLDQKAAVNNSAVPGQAGQSDGKLKIEDDDVAYGFNLGLMLTPRDGTRFGLTYRSEVDLEFRDTASLNNIGTGIQYDWNKDVTVGAAYEYLDAGEAEIDQEEGGPLQGPFKGDYDTNAIHFFAFNLIWKF